jgi:S1-C subfamily serine protease
MTWLDLVLLAIVVLVASWGWRTGALMQLLTIGGFWLGIVVGVLLVLAFGHQVSGTAQLALVLGIVFGCAFAFGAIGEWSARRLRNPLRRSTLRRVDQAFGVAVSVVTSLLAIWLVGNLLATSAIPSVNEAVRRSGVVRTINRAMPTLPDLFARIESFLSTQGFPVVFVNPPPGLVAPAPLPDAQSTEAAAVAVRASTVRVVGQACGYLKSGSGFVAEPGLVVTNAHVVAGESATDVDDQSGAHRASVVAFDPRLDLALLRVPDLTDLALPIRSETVARGTTAAITGYPGGGTFHAEPGTVDERFEAVGLDIYGGGLATRQVYELNGVVLPGNSGGPLVATGQPSGTAGIPTGTVIGVVFASSPSDPNTGYALTMGAVVDEISKAGVSPVSTGACLP